jgi:hypothetical protein
LKQLLWVLGLGFLTVEDFPSQIKTLCISVFSGETCMSTEWIEFIWLSGGKGNRVVIWKGLTTWQGSN